MRYCEISDVRLQHPLIPPGEDPMILANIEKSSAFISGYLGYIFDDMPNTPPLIRGLTQELALFYVLRTLYASNTVEWPGWLEEHFTKVRETLDRIARGATRVFDLQGFEIPVVPWVLRSTTQEELPIFDLKKPEEWELRVGPEYLMEPTTVLEDTP
jgi:hypothetical protein